MPDKNPKLALITGGNRGLGLETSRQLARKGLSVILTARDASKGSAIVNTLAKEGLEVIFHPLDVTQSASIQALGEFVTSKFGRLDVLVNNAGVMLDTATAAGDSESSSPLRVTVETIRKTLETNTLGVYEMCQTFFPLMKKNGYGRIVNVSSGMGQLSEMEGGWPAYRISKTAVNAVTRIFAAEAQQSKLPGILVNSACPGWVKTDMGGPEAELTVSQGADTLVWLATLPEGGPTGGFFRERKPIAW